MIRRCAAALLTLSVGLLAVPASAQVADPTRAATSDRVTLTKPVASHSQLVDGETFTLTGALKQSPVARTVQLQIFVGGTPAWRAVDQQRVASGGSYRFSRSADFDRARFRVFAPSAREGGRSWRVVTSSPTTVTAVAQAAELVVAPVLAQDAAEATVRFVPARPGRAVELELLDAQQAPVSTVRVVQDQVGEAQIAFAPTAYGLLDVRARALATDGVPEVVSTTVRTRIVPSWRVAVAAHRGGGLEAPENTLPAFEQAAARGVEYLETDARVTSDGVWVLMHDADLRRTTDAATVFPGRDSYLVSAFTAAEVAQLDAGKANGSAPRAKVPRLDELLDLVERTGVKVLLEAKSGPAGALLTEVAKRSGAITAGAGDRVVLCSTSPAVINAWRKQSPEAALSLVSEKLPTAEDSATSDIVVVKSTSLTAAAIDFAHQRGQLVFAYTPNDEKSLWDLADLHVDGVVTDVPRLAGLVLLGR